jgi:hypothetical protein
MPRNDPDKVQRSISLILRSHPKNGKGNHKIEIMVDKILLLKFGNMRIVNRMQCLVKLKFIRQGPNLITVSSPSIITSKTTTIKTRRRKYTCFPCSPTRCFMRQSNQFCNGRGPLRSGHDLLQNTSLKTGNQLNRTRVDNFHF